MVLEKCCLACSPCLGCRRVLQGLFCLAVVVMCLNPTLYQALLPPLPTHSTLNLNSQTLYTAQEDAMPFQLPSLLYSIPRSLPLAVGLPVLLGSLNGKITADAVKTWCALVPDCARSSRSPMLA